MDIIKTCLIAVSVSIVATVLNRKDSSIAKVMILATGICILLPAIEKLAILKTFADSMDIKGFSETAVKMLKLTGIASISELTADFISDTGENSLAKNVILCGRIAIMSMLLPEAFEYLSKVLELTG